MYGCPVSSFAEQIKYRGNLGRTTVDQTGLTGKYDFKLDWTPDNTPVTDSVDFGPSIFTAVEEQLGLQLRPTKGPLDTIIIDHAEMPSEN